MWAAAVGVVGAMLLMCTAGAAGAAGVDRLDTELAAARIHKIVRAMTNQSRADSMNLPSNATSIRENITDTFSCQNRSYGYYADVDNDCQVFHVCLPRQGSRGARGAAYRWSFICPESSVFNQEVLVCTRPEDSINCTESPMYYDVNMDFGITEDDTMEDVAANENDKPIENQMNSDDSPVEEIPKQIQAIQSRKRNKNKRKHSQRIKIKDGLHPLHNINKKSKNVTDFNTNENETKTIRKSIEFPENIDMEKEMKIDPTENVKSVYTDLVEAQSEKVNNNEQEHDRRARKLRVRGGRRGGIRFEADVND